jgi:hypothetical protein
MIFATVVFILVGTLLDAFILRTYRGDALDKFALFMGTLILITGLILLLIS